MQNVQRRPQPRGTSGSGSHSRGGTSHDSHCGGGAHETIVFTMGILNESRILILIRYLGFDGFVFPQIDGVVQPQIGDLGFSEARRPPRKPPDLFLWSSDICFLAGDSYKPVMVKRPLRKPLDLFLCGDDRCYLTSDSCKPVMASPPPAKPSDFVLTAAEHVTCRNNDNVGPTVGLVQ